jgi:soluble lytic murein transglycosylase
MCFISDHRDARALRIALLAMAIQAPAPASAQALYGFVAGDGVAHFSDVRSDSRFELIIAAPAPGPARRSARPRPPDAALARTIQHAAIEAGVDPALVTAVAHVESGYDRLAVSPKGAQGLMQLMPDTARRFSVADPFDAAQNLSGGARYLATLLARYDDLSLALAAYNAGEAAVERHGRRIPPYPETQAYVPRVLSRYAELRAR